MCSNYNVFSTSIFNNKSESEFYLHKAIVPLREDTLPLLTKNLKDKIVTRTFVHQKSVFKKWKPDN